MSGLVIDIEIEGEQRLRIALKASVAAIDEIILPSGRQRQSIESTGEDGLDGAIGRRCMRHGSYARSLESLTAVGLGEMQDVLRTAQALKYPIGEQLIDQRGAARASVSAKKAAVYPRASRASRSREPSNVIVRPGKMQYVAF